MLANNGTNAIAGRLIDLHGLCRTCRKREHNWSPDTTSRQHCRTHSVRQIVCPIDIVLCCITIYVPEIEHATHKAPE